MALEQRSHPRYFRKAWCKDTAEGMTVKYFAKTSESSNIMS